MSDDETNPELEELREQTQRETRLRQKQADQEAEPDLTDYIADAMAEVEAGDRSKTLSLYDPRLAALVFGLEADGEDLEETVAALQHELGREIDTEEIDRSELLGLAVRVGLQEAAPDVVDAFGEAAAEQAREL